jgi:LPXTG-site transpeptidase (sortase) family protein
MKPGRFAGRKRYILLFILGMVVFLYPTISNLYYSNITMRIPGGEIFPSDTATQSPTGDKNTEIAVSDREFQQIKSDPGMKPLLSRELDYLKAYNKKLWENPGIVADPFGEDDRRSSEFEVSEDADGTSIFAYITIDRIHQTLPVYLGATNKHLKKGVAVIQGTSIPVGGEYTNSVIAGHTGLVQKFFTDLPELEPGDEILIKNRWETLYYKVTGNKLIWPDQEEYLDVIAGKDMITLLTCYHGTHENDRLLVFAERVYPEEKKKEKINKQNDINLYPYLSEVELKAKPWYEKPQAFVCSAAIMMFCLFLYVFSSKKKINK